ncbi:MAG: exosortase/archaeosortase family protein [Verrucomicrobiia bacterium]
MKSATQGGDPSALRWVIILLPLAYFWFRLINNLQVDWRTNPQYSYGLLVPFLCVGLLVRRWHTFTDVGGQRSEVGDQRSEVGGQSSHFSFSAFQLLAFALAFLYLPTRLIEAAVPEWNPIQWLLGIEAIGLTLCVIYLGKGRGWLRELAFPICFFFVAIPWPTLFETPIIQTLTRVSAAFVIELLGWMGVPAITHGNVIEVSTGMVGIDEACSGIRSFQSSLMISLFFGEFYRLSQSRRWLLVPLGFAFSLAFNVCRMSLLTLIAAKKGVDAISKYHDPAGITIAITCTLALWGLAVLMKRGGKGANRRRKIEDGKWESSNVQGPESEVQSAAPNFQLPNSKFRPSILNRLGLCLLVWLTVVEGGVQLWYHIRESHLKPGPAWTLTFPRDNPTFKVIPIDEPTRYLLRFDNGEQGAWTDADGTQWQGFYFSWLPGRVAGYLAKRHTPEICLAAAGLKLLSGPKLNMMNVQGVELPMRCYVFQTAEGVAQVFQCRWEAGATKDDYVVEESARYNLIRAIWVGRGDKGQKVLEFVISGMDDPERAKQALARELEKLIKVGAGSGGRRSEIGDGSRPQIKDNGTMDIS